MDFDASQNELSSSLNNVLAPHLTTSTSMWGDKPRGLDSGALGTSLNLSYQDGRHCSVLSSPTLSAAAAKSLNSRPCILPQRSKAHSSREAAFSGQSLSSLHTHISFVFWAVWSCICVVWIPFLLSAHHPVGTLECVPLQVDKAAMVVLMLVQSYEMRGWSYHDFACLFPPPTQFPPKTINNDDILVIIW